MGVKLFVIALFTLSIFALFSEVRKNTTVKKVEDIPIIMFTDATMYTINHNEVSQMVQAQNAARYKKRDELYYSTIVTRAKKENKEDIKDIIYADKIIKKDELYSFYENVKYDKEDIFSLRTSKIHYDTKNEIAYNKVPFTSVYNGDILNGTNLYIDNKIDSLKAKKTHFEINMNNQNRTN